MLKQTKISHHFDSLIIIKGHIAKLFIAMASVLCIIIINIEFKIWWKIIIKWTLVQNVGYFDSFLSYNTNYIRHSICSSTTWRAVIATISHIIILYTNDESNLVAKKYSKSFLAATKQLYEWYFLSVCPSVTPFWLCSHHRIIMKFSGIITKGQGKVHRGHDPT